MKPSSFPFTPSPVAAGGSLAPFFVVVFILFLFSLAAPDWTKNEAVETGVPLDITKIAKTRREEERDIAGEVETIKT